MDDHHQHNEQGDGGMMAMSSRMMQMSFYWGKDLTLLFSGWVTDNPVEYVLTILAVFCFAILHKFMAQQLQAAISSTQDHKGTVSRLRMTLLPLLLYAIYVATSYLLMLMVMSFNVGIFIAVVAGLCVGFLIFPRSSGGGGDGSPFRDHEACPSQA